MSKQCVARHSGVWCVEPSWFTSTLSDIRRGVYRQLSVEDAVNASAPPVGLTEDGIAVIKVDGPMMKGASKYGNVDSVAVRAAVRQLANMSEAKAIVLHIDSPGGTFAGTDELATDVVRAASIKPVIAQIEDLGASAAYYVASQATKVFATKASGVGSIGTYAVVEDTSGAAEASGVKVHVVASGPHKGTLADGVPITDETLAELRKRVGEINQFFLAAVQKGRGLSAKQVGELADGRMWMASEAMTLGLVDGVQNLDTTLAGIRSGWRSKARMEQRNRRLALSRLRG